MTKDDNMLHSAMDLMFGGDGYKAIHLIVLKHTMEGAPTFKACLVGGDETKVLAGIDPLPTDFDEASAAITKVALRLQQEYKGTGLDFVPSGFVTGMDADLAEAASGECLDLLEEAIEALELRTKNRRHPRITLGDVLEPSEDALQSPALLQAPKGPHLN